MYRDIFKLNWQFLFLSLLAGLIPWGFNLLPLVIIWVILWIYLGQYKEFKVPKTIWFWVFCAFFVLHVIGFLYSADKEDALPIAKEKIYFLLFPILLANYSFKKEQFKTLLKIFCISSAFVAGYLILRAFYYMVILKYPVFTYSKFTVFLSPSSISLYMIFSIAALYLGGLQLSDKVRKDMVIKLALSLVMALAVLFCSPKIGLISLTVTILLLSIYFIVKWKTFSYAIIFLMSFFIIGCGFFNNVPSVVQRMNNVVLQYNNTKGMDYWDLQRFNEETTAKGLNPVESNLARFLIWSSALPVIKEHLLFGVGTGDVSNALTLSAESKGIYAFQKYNTHDQYIETQMGLGLPGLFLLLFLTLGALIYALVKKDLLLAIFALLFILNFFVESMLIGNYIPLFFSLFLYLFIKVNTAAEQSKTIVLK